MANDNVVGRVMILLELPGDGIRRPQLPGEPYPNIHKGNIEIVNEIIQQAVSVADWASDGITKPDAELAKLSLVYEGGA